MNEVLLHPHNHLHGQRKNTAWVHVSRVSAIDGWPIVAPVCLWIQWTAAYGVLDCWVPFESVDACPGRAERGLAGQGSTAEIPLDQVPLPCPSHLLGPPMYPLKYFH